MNTILEASLPIKTGSLLTDVTQHINLIIFIRILLQVNFYEQLSGMFYLCTNQQI